MQTLLTGKPYTPAEKTDIRKTWMAHGWVPPSEQKTAKALFDADKTWELIVNKLETTK